MQTLYVMQSFSTKLKKYNGYTIELMEFYTTWRLLCLDYTGIVLRPYLISLFHDYCQPTPGGVIIKKKSWMPFQKHLVHCHLIKLKIHLNFIYFLYQTKKQPALPAILHLSKTTPCTIYVIIGKFYFTLLMQLILIIIQKNCFLNLNF